MEFIREDCIYARQSVDRKDSISIESQIDFCKYELKGGSCRVFKDKGYSGKNTDRPEFQKLLGEIRKGKVRRVIVYKLGPYKPLYSGLCNDDGAVSRV
jgi:hypothetical protein